MEAAFPPEIVGIALALSDSEQIQLMQLIVAKKADELAQAHANYSAELDRETWLRAEAQVLQMHTFPNS